MGKKKRHAKRHGVTIGIDMTIVSTVPARDAVTLPLFPLRKEKKNII